MLLKVVLSDFRSMTFVQDVAHVINYDMPGDIEMYTHRIGMLEDQIFSVIWWTLKIIQSLLCCEARTMVTSID